MKTSILSGLFLFLFCNYVINAQESRQLTREELNSELRKTLLQNDEPGSIAIIRDNRLLIKPFVDALIKESITDELKGKTNESLKIRAISEKTAKYFENIFGEKSLTIGVNYLTTWTREQKEKKLVADSLYVLGTKYRISGEKEKALECLKPALYKYEEILDERGEAEAIGGLGALFFNDYENYSEALNYYREALVLRQKVDDKQLIGNTLNSLGASYHTYLKDYHGALRYYEQAEVVRTEIGDQSGLRAVKLNKANSLKELGNQLDGNGKFHEALESLQKAYEIDSSINAGYETGEALSQMGFVYTKTGEYNKAAEKLIMAERIMKEENDSISLAGVFNHFGILFQKVGRTEKALEYLNNALFIYKRANDLKNQIPVIDNLGVLYFDLKDYTKAEEYHIRGLNIAEELNDTKRQTDYLLNLANDEIYLKDLDKAKSNYEEALVLARSQNNPDLIWKATVGLAENYEQKGDYEKAVALNDTVLNIIEGLRNTLIDEDLKASFIARERPVFEDLIGLLVTLYEKDRTKGYDKLAFSYAERSKSRVLLDLIGESKVKQDKGGKNSGNSGVRNQVPVSLDEAQRICPDKNTIILEYAVGDSSSCLWVITKSGHSLYKMPAGKKLQEQIETIRFALLDASQGISEFFTQAGKDLYNELIKPAEPFLKKKSKLVIIPDGVLNYLPFEVLFSEFKKTTGEDSYTDIPFLVKKYPVSYVQSASVLRTLISKTAKGKEAVNESKILLAFGDPAYEDTLLYPRKKYPRLEFSGREVENIASFFKEGSTEIYLREKATEENLNRNNDLGRFNYLHFATHGLIDEEKPDLSSLVLTSRKYSGEDGFLQAKEIFDLKLNADMVVLSACQTGLGKLIRGEGMVGLTRAFMYAGTPSVVVSLWSVSDISTSVLMSEFYKNLIKNKLSKTDALRKAKLSLMSNEKYAHPFYWAPFILIGDWR